MFTGIIEEMGSLLARKNVDEKVDLVIGADLVLSDLEIGHSIAVNGVCLTVVKIETSSFTVQVIPETLDRTELGDLSIGDLINLERAMLPTARFHGHVVQGHVETVAIINHIAITEGETRMTLTIDHDWLRFCIPKGSITMDGVSLTIADISTAGITVALIPHTLSMTNLGKKAIGDQVNIETDIIARYLERFWEYEMDEDPKLMDVSRSQRWGFGES